MKGKDILDDYKSKLENYKEQLKKANIDEKTKKDYYDYMVEYIYTCGIIYSIDKQLKELSDKNNEWESNNYDNVPIEKLIDIAYDMCDIDSKIKELEADKKQLLAKCKKMKSKVKKIVNTINGTRKR